MDEILVEKIIKYKKSGAKLMFRQRNSDEQRLKLRHGPAGIFVKRFDMDNETAQMIKNRLKNLDKNIA